MHQCLSRYEQNQSGNHCLRVVVVTVPDYYRASGEEASVQYQYHQGADHAVFFDNEAEDIVLIHDGDHISLGAVARSLSEESAFAYGYFRADRLHGLVQNFLEFECAGLFGMETFQRVRQCEFHATLDEFESSEYFAVADLVNAED